MRSLYPVLVVRFPLKITRLFHINVLGVVGSEYFDYQDGAYNDDSTCAIVLNGTSILFGGLNEIRQISVVHKNGIKRINSLPFDFCDGKCHFNNGSLVLCFGRSSAEEKKLCRTRYLCYYS